MSEMIPAQAVGAAEEAAHEAFVMWKWSELDHHESREFFTAILEAAAPHMLAGAWDEGYTLGYADCANKQESNRPNPYMLNNEGEK